MKVFKGAPIAKEMHADGSLTVHGVTSLLDNTVVNTTAVVNGKALFGSRLRVDEDSTFSMNTNIDGSTEVLSTMTVMKNATVNGDAVLGSVGTQIVAEGKIAVRGIEGGPSVLTVDPGDTGVAITGNLIANDAVQFSDDIDVASGAYGIDVYSSTLVVAPMTVEQGVTISDKLHVEDLFDSRSSFLTRADCMFGETIHAASGTAAVNVRGNVVIEDMAERPIFSVSKDTGSVLMIGQVTLQGAGEHGHRWHNGHAEFFCQRITD